MPFTVLQCVNKDIIIIIIICTSHHQLHIQTLYIIPNVVFTMVKKTFIKWTAIEESSSTYIRGLSKINANILGI